MPKAYIIEVRNRTAGIVTADERGFHCFSAERTFDRLEGRQFVPLAMRSARRGRCSTRSVMRRANLHSSSRSDKHGTRKGARRSTSSASTALAIEITGVRDNWRRPPR